MNKAKLSVHLNIYEKNSLDKITKGQNIKIVTEWRSTTHTLFHVTREPNGIQNTIKCNKQ
jgi:hypothetical protein